MLKNAYFERKNVKFFSASGAPSPNSRYPPAAGGSAPRLPALLLPPAITTLSSCFLMHNAFYYTHNYSNVPLLILSHFLHLFFYFKLCSFCWGGARIFLAPGRRVP